MIYPGGEITGDRHAPISQFGAAREPLDAVGPGLVGGPARRLSRAFASLMAGSTATLASQRSAEPHVYASPRKG
jgi:hypothetical protein